MDYTNRAKKAWETMKNKSPGEKAKDTKNRKKGARKAVEKVKRINFQSEKIGYLLGLKVKCNPRACVVCGDTRRIVLQDHHIDQEGVETIKLCANCHDIVRRGKLDDLQTAHEKGTPHNYVCEV